MPTINQLPPATAVAAGDQLPISQAGSTRSITLGSMLAATQPAITTATNTLLGRVSLAPGGPEPVGVGAGLAIAGGSLTSTGVDHAAFPVSSGLTVTDDAIINSAGQPRRLPLSQLRGLFRAGANVTIDSNGVIAATGFGGGGGGGGGGGTGITNAPATVAITATDLVGVSQAGQDRAISLANLLSRADVSKTAVIPTGGTTATPLADHAARTVDPKDFGAKGDGVTDDYPAFVAAIASARSAPVILHVTRPAVSYAISRIVVGLNASVLIDDGVTFSGAAASGPFYVGRTEQRASGLHKSVAQGSQLGTPVAVELDVTNNGPHAAYGEFYTYQAFLSAADTGLTDISKAELAHWHNAQGPGLMGHWFVTCSPDPSEAPTAVYGMTAAEVNVVYAGPDTGWKPNPAGLNHWAAGFNFVPDAGYQYFGNGGHVLWGWAVNQNFGANRAGVFPKTYNAFLVGSDAIAPNGRAVYAAGDTTNLPANFPHASFEAGSGNWATGIRTDKATIASGMALQIAANQSIAWVNATEGVVAGIFSGTGAPSLAVPAGSIYARRDGGVGTTLYVKETGAGATGWTPFSAAGTGTPRRVVPGGSDTPTAADDGGMISFTSSTAVTVTATNIGSGRSYSVMQQGGGQITVLAGSGVTLVSDKSTPSFTTARRGAMLSVTCDGSGTVFVTGNTQ